MGSPGVFTHGLAIKPGKPTILGAADGVWYIGLPSGSAMIVFDVIVAEAIRNLRAEKPQPYIYARMKTNIASSPGKQTYLLQGLWKKKANGQPSLCMANQGL